MHRSGPLAGIAVLGPELGGGVRQFRQFRLPSGCRCGSRRVCRPGRLPDTGNSLMQGAGVGQELRMREVGHADRSVNDRYTHPAGAGAPRRVGADGSAGTEGGEGIVIENETSVPQMFPEGTGATKSQSAGNGSAAAQMWWGEWGSNPRPADYEEPARLPLMLAERLHCPSVLVSRDLAGPGGTGQDGAGRDGCSHSVPIRRQGRGSPTCT